MSTLAPIALALQPRLRRVPPDDPIARGVFDAPTWVVIALGALLVLGVVAVLVRRARKRR